MSGFGNFVSVGAVLCGLLVGTVCGRFGFRWLGIRRRSQYDFWTFLLALFGSILYGLGWICEKSGGAEKWRLPVYAAGFFVAFLILCICRIDLKNSTDYVCYYYIRTGRAAVYKEQMDELTAILTDESVEDAVVPFIVGEQEPLVHLPVTLDKEEWSNQKMAQFFGKKSLVAIPRDEWEAQREIR